MDVNIEKGFARYSKLLEDNPMKGKAVCLILPQKHSDKKKVEKLVSGGKGTKQTINLKTVMGISFAFLMIVSGLIAGLFVMDMKNKKLLQNLKSQEKISQDLKAKNQDLSDDLDYMTDALSISDTEIGSLRQDIQNLIVRNQKLMRHVKSKNSSLEAYRLLHLNCSKEQEISKTVIEDLKIQNQNLTKDLDKIDSAKESMKHFIPDGSKQRWLLEASQNGNVDKVRFLLELGANVNVTGDLDNQPLHYAAEKGHIEVVKVLLQNGADVNAFNQKSKTPLHLATERGFMEVTKLLLQNGAESLKCSMPDGTKQRLLLEASESGNIDQVRFFLECGANVNVKGDRKNRPLHYAAENGHTEVVKLLLQNGADINATNWDGQTPLEFAVKEGQLEVTQLLLQNGADVNRRSSLQNLVFHYLSVYQYADLVIWTPLHQAAFYGQPQIAKVLLKHGAKLDWNDWPDGFIQDLKNGSYKKQQVLEYLKNH